MAEVYIRVLDDKCVGCKLCVKACPFDAVSMFEAEPEPDAKKKRRLARIDLTRCTLCGACVTACKFDAIEMMEKPAAAAEDLGAHRNVWVYAEQHEGEHGLQVRRIEPASDGAAGQDACRRALDALKRAADAPDENLIPLISDAVKAEASLGEISDAMRAVFGEHQEHVVL
jgi:formate hydrogenlyase subunit 6/NADH:ubiquinone oxidoreductase subunit I